MGRIKQSYTRTRVKTRKSKNKLVKENGGYRCSTCGAFRKKK